MEYRVKNGRQSKRKEEGSLFPRPKDGGCERGAYFQKVINQKGNLQSA